MNFIDQLAPFAVKHGLANSVLPSLIIAQGILESDSGKSELATKANNLFGIKAGSGWSGLTYTKRTSEQDKYGKVSYINAYFRKYPSYEGCVIDLVYKYTHGTGWEAHNRYAAVLNQTDYKKATAAVKAAGYATDVKYPDKLNKIIEQYDLTKYDKGADHVVKIALDAGHGMQTPGKRSPDDEREWSFNNKVLIACIEHLATYKGVYIRRLDDPSGKTDVPLNTRTDKANQWGADVLVSIHHNANTGKWGNHGGVETYVQEKTASEASKDLAALIQPRIVKAMGLANRGVRTKNLHMTRESKMPAVLTEGGFMDSNIDIIPMRSDAKLKAQGEAIAEGLAAYFGLKKKPTAPTPEKKEGDEMQFTSGTLKKEWETFLGSKAQREIAVKEAVKQGYNAKWIKDLEEGKIADGDIAALAVGALIRANK